MHRMQWKILEMITERVLHEKLCGLLLLQELPRIEDERPVNKARDIHSVTKIVGQ